MDVDRDEGGLGRGGSGAVDMVETSDPPSGSGGLEAETLAVGVIEATEPDGNVGIADGGGGRRG